MVCEHAVEVVFVVDDIDEGGLGERPRPLVAVDFGHVVWIEFVDNEDDVMRPRPADSEAKWLRFVTFPPFGEEARGSGGGDHKRWAKTGGEVRTLEIPDDLDLGCVGGHIVSGVTSNQSYSTGLWEEWSVLNEEVSVLSGNARAASDTE